MAEQFYTILTSIGQAAFANAQLTGGNVNLTTIKAGDGNGNYYEPTAGQTDLVNEVWSAAINRIYIDENNPNWFVVEGIIPSEIGGFTVREVGVFDQAGNLIAVGKYPATYKPAIADGATKDLYLRMICEVGNASAVTLKIDPSVVLASRDYVDQLIKGHAAYPLVHSTTDVAYQDSDYGDLAGAGTGLENEPKGRPTRYQDLSLTTGSKDYGTL